MAQVTLSAGLEGPDGAPVVVLGNSLGTTTRLWDRQLPALAGRFRVLRYDLRGHGTSPVPPGPYPIADLAGDVLALLDDFGVSQVCYCGVSLGGMIGMWLAANAPGRIGSLLLSCTSAFLGPAEMWRERAATVRASGMAAVSAQAAGRWFTPAFRQREPATVDAFIRTLEGVQPEGYAGCCEAIAAMDLRPALPAISVPTLVIAGAEDPATPPWHAAVIARAIAGAQLRVIRGASHLANVSQDGEFTHAMLAHLTAVTQPGERTLATGN